MIFGKDKGLTIYNDFSIKSGNINSLKGSYLQGIEEKSEMITLTFSNGDELLVNLQESAWHGPEAMELNTPEYPFVVWN